MKIICWLKNKLFGRRITSTDCIKREYYNGLFTELQEIHKRARNWSLPIKNRETSRPATDITLPEADDLEKLQLLMAYNQTEQQRKYTFWFIILTIVNIIVLIATFTIGFLFRKS